LAYQVRLAADHETPGRLYLTWLQARETATYAFPDTGNPITVTRSDDGGTTWGPPVRISSPTRQRVVAPAPAIGPRGEVYVLFLDLGNDSLDYHGAHEGIGGEPYPGPWTLVLARSFDNGVTWQEAVVEEVIVPTERVIVFFPPLPSLAVDQRSGRLFASFADARLGDPDVWVWTSGDAGATFNAASRVNDTPIGDGTSQYLSKLAVTPNGRVDVLYYDRRSDPMNVMNEVSLQSSFDGAKTFKPRLRLSDRQFDSRIGFGRERNLPDLGSRLALVSDERRSLAVWTDTRGGSEAANKQDLARQVIAFSSSPAIRGPLRIAGLIGLTAAALVFSSLWVWVRQRRAENSPRLNP